MAKQKFLVNIDLNGNQLMNVDLENLATAPSVEKGKDIGRMYFDTTKGKIGSWDGNKWTYSADYKAGEGIDSTLLAQGTVKVLNALSDSEKHWIEDQLFNKLFVASISANPSSSTFNGANVTVTFTLTTKYDNKAVDLDAVPEGWTKSAVGTYTKVGSVTANTGSSISSGFVSCTYNERRKTASSATYTNIKKSYLMLSTKYALSAADLTNLDTVDVATVINNGNNVAGTKTITVTTANSYAYFIIANTSNVNSITQFNQNFVDSPTSLVRTNFGTYKVYRSTLALGVGVQTVDIR